MASSQLPRFLGVTALAKYLGLSTDTIYRMERRRQLPRRVQSRARRVWFSSEILQWEKTLAQAARVE